MVKGKIVGTGSFTAKDPFLKFLLFLFLKKHSTLVDPLVGIMSNSSSSDYWVKRAWRPTTGSVTIG